MMYQDIDLSRKMKMLKDEQEKALEQEAEEKARKNMTYFNGYEQR